MGIQLEELAEKLIKEWDYDERQAGHVAEKLLSMDANIYAAFSIWLDSGIFSDEPSFYNYSPKKIDKVCRLKPPAVFLLLDWIRRDPETAITAMKRELLKTSPRIIS